MLSTYLHRSSTSIVGKPSLRISAQDIFLEALFLLVMLSFSRGAIAQGTAAEYAVKAVYMFNFAKFVEWPADVLAPDDSSIQMCLLGSNPFGKDIDEIARQKIKHRTIVLSKFLTGTSLPALKNCHLLFISKAEPQAKEIYLALDSHPVLVVSESAKSSMITFVVQDEKVRFRVDLLRARRSRLQISSQLLNLALSVD